MKTLFLVTTLLLATLAPAARADTMAFKSDKQFHSATSAVVAGTLTAVTDPWKAFGATVAAGAAKEWYDSKHRDKHSASYEDFAYDVMGAAAGAYVGHRIQIYRRDRTVFVGTTFEVK